MAKSKKKLDEIGPWSEIKLEIIRKYAKAYATILNNKHFKYFYIDGFAGAGVHVSKTTKAPILGSPLNALDVRPPFHHHFLIDLSKSRVSSLQALIGK